MILECHSFLKVFFSSLIILFWSFYEIKAQSSKFESLKRLSYPEKIWILTHPFIVFKAFKITIEVQKIAKEMKLDKDLDGDGNGGQIDAFRHAFWMSSLAQKIRAKAVWRLGVAHEKGNKIYFDKKKLEDGSLPDSIACQMDLKNNQIGIKIGKENKKINQEDLIILIKKSILEGKLWKIKKDKEGNFLDKKGHILDKKNWQGKWHNDKYLIKTNE